MQFYGVFEWYHYHIESGNHPQTNVFKLVEEFSIKLQEEMVNYNRSQLMCSKQVSESDFK